MDALANGVGILMMVVLIKAYPKRFISIQRLELADKIS
jgi:hypothetical protein